MMHITLDRVPYDSVLLLCPECDKRCDYIHFLDEPNWDWEKGVVNIPMYCEFGHHKFNFVFSFHKGNMEVYATKWERPPVTFEDLRG